MSNFRGEFLLGLRVHLAGEQAGRTVAGGKIRAALSAALSRTAQRRVPVAASGGAFRAV
jgi:hypothetical protein